MTSDINTITTPAFKDPHHGGDNQWRWNNGQLEHLAVGTSKWVKTRRVHPTPKRILALAKALEAYSHD